MGRLTTSARISVELVISLGSAWGSECTLEQVEKQAKEEALRILDRVLCGHGLGGDVERVSLVETKVYTITIKEGT